MRRALLLALLVSTACDTEIAPEAETDAHPGTSGSGADTSSGTIASSSGADSSSGGPVACTDSPDAMADCVEQGSYVETLEFVAQTRSPSEPHWQVVQDHLAEQLADFGYEVELEMYETGINVVGRLPGTLGTGDVVLSAHYDSVSDCAGADDNASGVAGIVEAARVLAMGSYEQNLVVAFWDQEEIGLLGSRAYVTRAVDAGDTVIANYNFEMIGYTDDTPGSQSIPAGFDVVFPEGSAQVAENEYRGDFITLVADDLIAEAASNMKTQAARFELPVVHLELTEELKTSPLLSDLRRSDHAPFWDANLPAMMITDTSEFRYPNYHCNPEPDVVGDLDHAFSYKVIATTVGAAATSLGLLGPAE